MRGTGLPEEGISQYEETSGFFIGKTLGGEEAVSIAGDNQ